MNKLIIDTLSFLGAPVCFQTYEGTKQPDGSIKIIYPYITFFSYLEKGESFANNEETSIGSYMQVDVWSNVNYKVFVKSVLDALKQANFIRKYTTDMYEDDTKIFHKVIRVFKYEEVL